MEEQNKEQVLGLDEEQLEELLGGISESDKIPPFEIDLHDYDLKEFQNGIKETSHLAGVITALLNVGVSENFVLDYLLSQQTIEHNLKVAQLNKEMNVEVAKSHKAAQEKYEL